MKIFFASLCAFAVLIAIIIGNCFYISHTADSLERALKALPLVSDASPALADLEEYWKARRTEVSFSISFNEIRDLENCLIQLRTASECNDAYEFELARSLALKAVQRMRRLERFSWEGII